MKFRKVDLLLLALLADQDEVITTYEQLELIEKYIHETYGITAMSTDEEIDQADTQFMLEQNAVYTKLFNILYQEHLFSKEIDPDTMQVKK
ncbi:hypothetical protein [Alkalicoccobacillus gibsonii]|uniref:hypothetical protein n=1 Tax=Alkalicoccobacillus gibsonii TaxID=79881 RepID=UPI0035110B48